jgi:hypothetical protein
MAERWVPWLHRPFLYPRRRYVVTVNGIRDLSASGLWRWRMTVHRQLPSAQPAEIGSGCCKGKTTEFLRNLVNRAEGPPGRCRPLAI